MPFKSKKEQLEYQKRWVAKRRADYMQDKSCCRCGETENLQLDHVDPNKKTEHRIWSWARERMLVELAKCQILCKDCHVNKTNTDGSRKMPTHGNSGMYENYNCRCDLCREWKRKVNAQRKPRGWV